MNKLVEVLKDLNDVLLPAAGAVIIISVTGMIVVASVFGCMQMYAEMLVLL